MHKDNTIEFISTLLDQYKEGLIKEREFFTRIVNVCSNRLMDGIKQEYSTTPQLPVDDEDE